MNEILNIFKYKIKNGQFIGKKIIEKQKISHNKWKVEKEKEPKNIRTKKKKINDKYEY